MKDGGLGGACLPQVPGWMLMLTVQLDHGRRVWVIGVVGSLGNTR